MGAGRERQRIQILQEVGEETAQREGVWTLLGSQLKFAIKDSCH